MSEQVDAIVIGLGVAGQDVAHRLRDAGLSVLAVERHLVGGECPNWACVPTKMMVRAADVLAEARRVPQLAGSATVESAWTPVARRIREEATHGWDDRELAKELEDKGIRVVRGPAALAGPGRVRVGDQEFTAVRAIVLATGTEPAVPDIDGLAGTPYWTNRDVAELTTLPASVAILGGGPVGAEFAQILCRFGVAVTLIEAADRLLAAEDPQASQFVADVLRADGVHVLVGTEVERVAHEAGQFTVVTATGPVTAEKLLVATGRRVNLPEVGLETVGLDPAAPAIEVDGGMKAADGLWAIGDITGHGQFTHVATYQARIAAADILGQDHTPADYRAVPRCVFVDPELGSVGLTQDQAEQHGIRVRIGRARIPESARGFIHHVGNEGFIKLVADADRDVLVGAVSAGPSGGEVLGLLTLAVHAQVPLRMLRDMVYAYPTFCRAVEDALNDMSES